MPHKCNCDVFSRPEGSDHLPWCEWWKPTDPVVPSPKVSVAELTGKQPVEPPGASLAQPRKAPATGKRYLGDGVYVDRNELGLVLTTENGIAVTNTIVLEPEVWTALHRYVETLKDADV